MVVILDKSKQLCCLRRVTALVRLPPAACDTASGQVCVRGSEIVALDEPVIALIADPGISVCKCRSMTGIFTFVQFPTADLAAISFPPALYQQELVGILGKADIEGHALAILLKKQRPEFARACAPKRTGNP